MIRCLSDWKARRELRWVVLVVLFFGCAAASAPAQLNARPASVVLVATLESLSLGVAPGHISAQPAAASRAYFAVTTSWALPANLTTLHLVQLTPDMDWSRGGFTIFSQTSGDSSRAASRAEELELPAASHAPSEQNPALNQKPTLLLIEAL